MNVFDLTITFLENRCKTPYNYASALRHAVWLLSNLCRDKPPENFQFTYKAFPTFALVVDKLFNDLSVFMDSSYAMAQLALIYLSFLIYCN